MRARRTASNAPVWPNQHPLEEWAVQTRLEEILQQSTMAGTVRARTGGTCYVPGCESPISSYPHALVESDGGTHHAVNRLGVCAEHLTQIRTPMGGFALRRQLQGMLVSWYMMAGVRGSAWGRMALGRAPIQADLPAVGPATWEVRDEPSR